MRFTRKCYFKDNVKNSNEKTEYIVKLVLWFEKDAPKFFKYVIDMFACGNKFYFHFHNKSAIAEPQKRLTKRYSHV